MIWLFPPLLLLYVYDWVLSLTVDPGNSLVHRRVKEGGRIGGLKVEVVFIHPDIVSCSALLSFPFLSFPFLVQFNR
jgi:hypothetical protein